MKTPLWKKWWSYVVPQLLESASSPLHPNLEVWLAKGRLQLVSGNAIYSWDDLYRNFSIAFDALHITHVKIEDVLLLGLGLGSVPYQLEKQFGIHARYTAVELDEAVVGLASKYTLPRLRSSVEIVSADAEIFVEVCTEQFDLVVMDIFEDNVTPSQFETSDFLLNCQRLLRPTGLLLYNRMYHSAADRHATELFGQTFLTIFPDAQKIDTDGNLIFAFRNHSN